MYHHREGLGREGLGRETEGCPFLAPVDRGGGPWAPSLDQPLLKYSTIPKILMYY